MPISTNLNVAPYYDDYNPSKDYYKFAFQPGVSVQVRELNQLQTLLQAQIERFGDNIFASGTIVSGCNLSPLSPYPYIKINDQTEEGGAVSPVSFVGLRLKNETTGLQANVLDYKDGFQSADPDLKTLYIAYINSGFNGDQVAFSSGDIVKAYDGVNFAIERVNIADGGTNFANGDAVIATSAIAVTVDLGIFSNGEFLVNGSGANLEIIGVDDTTLVNSSQVILKLKPRTVDLANSFLTEAAWTVSLNDSIVGITSGAQATITGIFGFGFKADLVTNPSGTAVNINITEKGFGYAVLPHISIQSNDNPGGIGSLNLAPQNWKAEISVASVTNSVGDGYAFMVGEGTIYQKGYFLRVSPQITIIDKYSTKPDNLVAGFITNETIITSNVDDTLNDPAAGKNNGAPGANRLKMVPQLVTISANDASGNSTFLPLVEWDNGNLYYQRQQTVYSTIGDKIAEGINDASGDFFTNPFLVTTQSPVSNDTSASFDIIVDPGSAYIKGYKVGTQSNYTLNYPTSLLSSNRQNFVFNINYDAFIDMNNIGGVFAFNTGAACDLYDTAKTFRANSTLVQAANTAPQGNLIGTMRMRSLNLNTANPTNPIYRLHVYDVAMANGKNFGDVRSVYYTDGANVGIADVITSLNPTTSKQRAIIANSQYSALLYPITDTCLKNVANTSYPFRTIDSGLTCNTAGIITKDISANASWFFPYSGSLSSGDLSELYVVPTTTDFIYAANAVGTLSVANTTANVTGTTTAFLTEFAVGDWMYMYDAASYKLAQIQSITNNTFLVVDANCSFTNATSNFVRAFPKHIPLPLGSRAGLTANVDNSQQILKINLGGAVSQACTVALGVDIEQVGITQGTKTPVRNVFVRFNLSTHDEANTGPWCIGVPDVFRLRGVYIGNSSVDTTGSNHFQDFYIDNNQNPDFYGLSWLFKKPGSSVRLATSDYILCQFDYYTSSGPHFYTPVSYIGSNTDHIVSIDSLSLGQLDVVSGAVSSWEIPEFFTSAGYEVDLTKCIDFRDAVANTVAPSTTASLAPTNPSAIETFDSTEKYFPVPGGRLTANVQSWMGNFVSVFIDKNAKIITSNATITTTKVLSAPTPVNTMKLADILIPPYPAIPQSRSVRLTEVMNTGVINQKYAPQKYRYHAIITTSTIEQNQTKVYTQSDIANIDRRLQNCEYQINLNQVESLLNNTVIPSANDPTLSRYKFGFFAEEFTKPKLVDPNHPQWAASIKNGYLWPDRLEWDVAFGDAFAGPLPYIDSQLINQHNATIGNENDPTAQPRCAIDIANTVAYQLQFRTIQDSNGLYAPKVGTVDVVNLTLADATHMANAGSFGVKSDIDYWSTVPSGSSVELFFYFYDNPIKVEILQGNTVVVNSTSATALSAVDISNLTGSQSVNWFNDNTSLYMRPFVDAGDGYLMYAGKLKWNYNGSGGSDITIRTTNGVGARNWRWVMSYPINGSSAGCKPPTSNTPGTDVVVKACGNAPFWQKLQTALMRAIAGNGGTTTGLDGTIDYQWGQGTKHSPLLIEGIVDLGDYLANPMDSKLTIDAIGLYSSTLNNSADQFIEVLGSNLTFDPMGGVRNLDAQWGKAFDVINNKVVPVWYWFNPATGTLVETTSGANASTGVIRTELNWAATAAAAVPSEVKYIAPSANTNGYWYIV